MKCQLLKFYSFMEIFEKETPKTVYSLLNQQRLDAFGLYLSTRMVCTTASTIFGSLVGFLHFLQGIPTLGVVNSRLLIATRTVKGFISLLEQATIIRRNNIDERKMTNNGECLSVSTPFLGFEGHILMHHSLSRKTT